MDKLKMQTANKADENFKKLAEMFPNAVTETIDENGEVVRAIDKEVLMQEINTKVVDGKEERYQFTWPDKKKSVLLANAPISKTLRPCREESVDFDTTENLYIEGDNLEVLKLLQETYLGKIKMIYIDPPYNTGNDFVYEDDFAQSTEEYLANSGQFDEEGNCMVQNTESNGRFHTDWLNMIYTRIRISKDLLQEDGVIFVSIDDGELKNILKNCDEIFGSSNFVSCITRIAKTTSFRGNYFAPSKDYIVVYAKNISVLPSFQDEVSNDDQFNKIETEGERKGEYYRDDIAFYLSTLQTRPNQRYFIECPDGELVVPPGTTIPQIEQDGEKVLPNEGDGVWRWEQKQYLLKKNLLSFKQTKSSPLINQDGQKAKWNIYTKSYLNDKKEKGNIPRDLLEGFLNRNGSEELKKLDIPFSFPKPSKLIKHLIKILNTNKDIIVLDFFSGSATTAHAVMQLNAEDGGHRKFIMVQLPEKTDEKSEAYKAGYKTICEIGKERIRRAGQKIKEDSPLTTQDLDIGFRVLKCDTSNMKDVFYRPDEVEQTSFDNYADNIKEDRTPEDLLFQVMLDLGILLSSKIEETTIGGCKVFNVADGFLYACFDNNISDEVVTAVAKEQPYYAVFRDSSIASDSVLTNFDQIFASISPSTVRKVL
ncbi:adenine specific DNA methylase Mod [Firmicutes bacterium CAG:238]|nr:adenine specific DNA methylase Mod [Firmicutes bacterium CAG:238]